MSIVSLISRVDIVGVLLGGSGIYQTVVLKKPDVGVLLKSCRPGIAQQTSDAALNASIDARRKMPRGE